MIVKKVVMGAGEFTPQGLANTAWAFAVLRYADTRLGDAVAASSLQRLSHFDLRALANLSWAFSK